MEKETLETLEALTAVKVHIDDSLRKFEVLIGNLESILDKHDNNNSNKLQPKR